MERAVKVNKKFITRFFLISWVILWINFLLRPYFVNNRGGEYKNLLSLSSEEKKAYILGPQLYEFIQFCHKYLPANSNYWLEGLEQGTSAHTQAVYYLLPHFKYIKMNDKHPPEYLLVYNLANFSKNGFTPYKILNERSYILKRVSAN